MSYGYLLVSNWNPTSWGDIDGTNNHDIAALNTTDPNLPMLAFQVTGGVYFAITDRGREEESESQRGGFPVMRPSRPDPDEDIYVFPNAMRELSDYNSGLLVRGISVTKLNLVLASG